MKRLDLIRHLKSHGCEFLREGGKHSIYVNPASNRTFKIGGGESASGSRTRQASRRMAARVANRRLSVGFLEGPSKHWPLPPRADKAAIRNVRAQALRFAADNGATPGQQAAVMKALTSSGFHITK